MIPTDSGPIRPGDHGNSTLMQGDSRFNKLQDNKTAMDAFAKDMIARTVTLVKEHLNNEMPEQGLKLILKSVRAINEMFIKQTDSPYYDVTLKIADNSWTAFHYQIILLTKRAVNTGRPNEENHHENQAEPDQELPYKPASYQKRLTFAFDLISSIRHFYESLMEKFLSDWGSMALVNEILQTHSMFLDKTFVECSDKITGMVIDISYVILLRLGDICRYYQDVAVHSAALNENQVSDYSEAHAFYTSARRLKYDEGEPYTRLGKLCSGSRQYVLAVYYILKSIVIEKPSVTDNLRGLRSTVLKRQKDNEKDLPLKLIATLMELYGGSEGLSEEQEEDAKGIKALYEAILLQYEEKDESSIDESGKPNGITTQTLVQLALIAVMMTAVSSEALLVRQAFTMMSCSMDWIIAGHHQGFHHLRILVNWFRKRYSLREHYMTDLDLINDYEMVPKLVRFGNWLQNAAGLVFDPQTSVPSPRPDVNNGGLYEEQESLGVLVLNNGLDDLPSGLLTSLPRLNPPQLAAQCLLSELYEMTYKDVGIQQESVHGQINLAVGVSSVELENVGQLLSSMDMDVDSHVDFGADFDPESEGLGKHQATTRERTTTTTNTEEESESDSSDEEVVFQGRKRG